MSSNNSNINDEDHITQMEFIFLPLSDVDSHQPTSFRTRRARDQQRERWGNRRVRRSNVFNANDTSSGQDTRRYHLRSGRSDQSHEVEREHTRAESRPRLRRQRYQRLNTNPVIDTFPTFHFEFSFPIQQDETEPELENTETRYNLRPRVSRPQPQEPRAPRINAIADLPSFLQIFLQLITQNDFSRNGNPPASQDAIAKLVKLHCSDGDCVICLEKFEISASTGLGDSDPKLLQMPCLHTFHSKCLKTWLVQSNQCPTCRYEILTDNEEYNEVVRGRQKEREKEDKVKSEKVNVNEKKEEKRNLEQGESTRVIRNEEGRLRKRARRN